MIIEDTTLLDYSQHPATEDLGVIGDGGGRGFELHSALAVRVEAWTLGPTAGRHGGGIVRPAMSHAPAGPRRARRAASGLSRPRKSQTWAAAFKAAGRPPGGQPVDLRGGSGIGFLRTDADCASNTGWTSLSAAYQDRRLADEAGKLQAALARRRCWDRARWKCGRAAGSPRARRSWNCAVCGWIWTARGVPAAGRRRWRGCRAWWRSAKCHAPEGVKEPLHWILLTSLPCDDPGRRRSAWSGAIRRGGGLKNITKPSRAGRVWKQSQLERAPIGWNALIAVLAVVAVRLLSTKMLARSRPEAFEAAASFGPEMLALLEKKLGPPKGGWNNRNVLIATARLGGFLARKHDGMPGWQTIWRGWQRLMWMCEGVEL